MSDHFNRHEIDPLQASGDYYPSIIASLLADPTTVGLLGKKTEEYLSNIGITLFVGKITLSQMEPFLLFSCFHLTLEGGAETVRTV
jgi:hypothetical protein